MNLKWEIKRFDELSLSELYNLLALRSEVFIVEQNCVYQDVDYKDVDALHLLGTINNKLVAYARLFDAGNYLDNASIGRVLVKQEYRINKFGHQLMKEAILAVQVHFNTTKITISAQVYLVNFYEQHGFSAVGSEYLEDDIPHIQMQKN